MDIKPLAARALFAGLAVLVLQCRAQPAMPAESRIDIVDTGSSYSISVPRSRVVLDIPKGDLRVSRSRAGGATDSPRYFQLADKESVVSGWFEPAERFNDLQKSWQVEMEGIQGKGIGPPGDVENLEIGAMKAIVYSLPTTAPQLVSVHVRSSYLDAGTWVDLHFSVTAGVTKEEARARVLALARTAQFRIKDDSAVAKATSPTEFFLLVGRARGAIRSQIERGQGCFPWIVLARDLKDASSFKDLGFNAEIVREFGDATPARLGQFVASAAGDQGYRYSVVGTCDTDPSRGGGKESNVIVLVVEGKDQPAMLLRFPFERDAGGQVVYIEEKAAVEPAEHLVFTK